MALLKAGKSASSTWADISSTLQSTYISANPRQRRRSKTNCRKVRSGKAGVCQKLSAFQGSMLLICSHQGHGGDGFSYGCPRDFQGHIYSDSVKKSFINDPFEPTRHDLLNAGKSVLCLAKPIERHYIF